MTEQPRLWTLAEKLDHLGRRVFPPRVLHPAYRAGHFVFSLIWLITKPRIDGVKVVIQRGEDILWVRHTYGDRLWDLPGGALNSPDELPEQAARRETAEELGLTLVSPSLTGGVTHRGRSKHGTMWVVVSEATGEPHRDPYEIAETRWEKRPPGRTSPHVKAILRVALSQAVSPSGRTRPTS